MPTVPPDEQALHDLTLTAGEEVVVTFEAYSRAIEVVVTTPGTAPIYWTATDEPATIAGGDTRVIPAGAYAIDTATARRITTRGTGRLRSMARLISAAPCTVSVQRGAL